MILHLLNISRPRFWMYVVGSYLIGIGAHLSLSDATIANPDIALWLLYFTFPANIFIYGINDIADNDTDTFNAKKGTYEARVRNEDKARIVWTIIFTHLLFLPLFINSSTLEKICLGIFFLLNIAYSLPPLRLKAIPILDSVSNGIICGAIGCMGYIAAGGTSFSIPAILAGVLWSTAMHAYSAVPDISADSQAKVRTIATLLGAQKTIFLCLALYISIAAIFLFAGYLLHIFLVIPYVALMIMSIWSVDIPSKLFKVYMIFPLITYVVGYLVYLFNGIV